MQRVRIAPVTFLLGNAYDRASHFHVFESNAATGLHLEGAVIFLTRAFGAGDLDSYVAQDNAVRLTVNHRPAQGPDRRPLAVQHNRSSDNYGAGILSGKQRQDSVVLQPIKSALELLAILFVR